MARRRSKKAGGAIDLFAFLNIMAATIGVQTLLIVICALQIKPGVSAIQLLPAGGEAKGKVANYIICEGGGKLDLLTQGNRTTLSIKDKTIDSYLDRIAENPKPQYLVIGVRPSAFRDFESIRSKAEARRISVGYEPLEAGLKVQFPSSLEGLSTRAES